MPGTLVFRTSRVRLLEAIDNCYSVGSMSSLTSLSDTSRTSNLISGLDRGLFSDFACGFSTCLFLARILSFLTSVEAMGVKATVPPVFVFFPTWGTIILILTHYLVAALQKVKCGPIFFAAYFRHCQDC